MIKNRLHLFFFCALFVFSCCWSPSYSWGFWAHKRINRIAVFTLPSEMIGFYKYHIEYLTEHAVDPDKRRYAVKDEAPRHFIDIDHYGRQPFDSMPESWNKAVEKYTEDTLMAYGINPWYIARMMNKLTNAFKEGNGKNIMKYSADIGHYIADAHVPLHTSENYNGQLTNQYGIHGFWESRLPELFGDRYDYFVGRANYVDEPLKQSWSFIKMSHAAVDSVLLFEEKLNAVTEADEKYSFEQKGNVTNKVYSETYSRKYNELLNNMVERRMRSAILAVGSFWYTAWVNAGQPDLSKVKGKIEEDEKLPGGNDSLQKFNFEKGHTE